MRKLLIGLLFLIGWSVQAQIVPASQVQISQFGRLKKLTVKPATPAVGFGNFYNLNDSLHYEISTKNWNLGKLTYADSLGYYLLKNDTLYFLHDSDLQGIRDSLLSRYLYDANTILRANSDNTPTPVTISVQQIVGRATGGTIRGLDIDSDLTSVSTGDSTLASAKATKAMGDLKALKTTTISTTLPLTGGGDLSANRTLAINPATPALPGSMSAEDKTKLNNLEDYTRNLGSMASANIDQFVQSKDPEVKFIATNGENNIVLSNQLSTRTRVFYNGSLVENTRWTGVGTDILTLSLDTRVYDMIIIAN